MTNPLHRLRRRHAVVLAACIVVLLLARALLPLAVRDYVNHVLNRLPGYAGHVDDIHLAVWRGAYEMRGLTIRQLDSPTEEPLLQAPSAEVSVLWGALFRGHVVARYHVVQPKITFAAGHEGHRAQMGKGADWIGVIKQLSFLRIDRFEIADGTVRYSDAKSDPPVDIALTRVDALITNLTNSERQRGERVASLELHALAAGQAGVSVTLRIDPFAARPDFELKARLLQLQVTRMRDFLRAYTVVDPKSGTLDVVTELNARDGGVKGYVKPLFHDLKLVEWKREKDPLHVVTDAFAGLVNLVLQNQDKQQLATVAPIDGRLDTPDVDVMATLGNLLRNAVVKAFTPTFEHPDKSG